MIHEHFFSLKNPFIMLFDTDREKFSLQDSNKICFQTYYMLLLFTISIIWCTNSFKIVFLILSLK